jgi:hypothetical protein
MKPKHTLIRLTLAALAVSVLGLSAAAQEQKIAAKDVPAAVITAFKTAYPNATIRGYSKERENGKLHYEIESLDGTQARDLLYNPDGTVAETEETIAASDLPADAQQALHKQYPRAVISKAERNTAGEKVTYEVSARQGKRRISMEFDSNGKVLKSRAR